MDLTSKKFGMLTVIERAMSNDGAIWSCMCECGVTVLRRTSVLNRSIKNGVSPSCGCITARTKVIPDGIKCHGCGQLKQPSHFCRLRDGYQAKCKECSKQWRSENAEYIKKKKSEYHQKNKAILNAAASRRQSENKEQSNERSRKWRERNQQKRREVANSWVKRNPEYLAQRSRLRYAKRTMAQPNWADIDAMTAIYREAREKRLCGESVSVDHIVPLVSNIVCGLHNHFNLQIMSTTENIRKSNKYWPDMP